MFSPGWNPARAYDNEIEWVEPRCGERLTIVEDDSRSILSENKNPDLDFRWSLNPYRGCFHGCAYCYPAVPGGVPRLREPGRHDHAGGAHRP